MTEAQHLILGAALFAPGAAVGSFLNVCLHRVPRRLSVLRPRSRCPRCLAPIEERDNVPVLGWLLLRGRCRRCQLPISARYPAIEALVGLLFATTPALWSLMDGGDPLDAGPAALAIRLIGVPLLLTVLLAAGLLRHEARESASGKD